MKLQRTRGVTLVTLTAIAGLLLAGCSPNGDGSGDADPIKIPRCQGLRKRCSIA